MKNIAIIVIIIMVSCKQAPKSEIEIIKFDTSIIDFLHQNSDTTYTEYIGLKDFYTFEFYVNRNDSIINKIGKDSNGNVVGHFKIKNDIVFFAFEYYPNGQAKWKWPEIINAEYVGKTRYYYEDGRVRCEGQFKNELKSGEWKNYNKDGYLISIDDYGKGNFQPITTTELK